MNCIIQVSQFLIQNSKIQRALKRLKFFSKLNGKTWLNCYEAIYHLFIQFNMNIPKFCYRFNMFDYWVLSRSQWEYYTIYSLCTGLPFKIWKTSKFQHTCALSILEEGTVYSYSILWINTNLSTHLLEEQLDVFPLFSLLRQAHVHLPVSLCTCAKVSLKETHRNETAR